MKSLKLLCYHKIILLNTFQKIGLITNSNREGGAMFLVQCLFVCWLVGWLVCLVGWPAGWLGWLAVLVGWLAGWPAGCLAGVGG